LLLGYLIGSTGTAGDIGVTGGIDHPLCKYGLPTRLALRYDAPDDTALHHRFYCQAVQDRLDPCLLYQLVGHVFQHFSIKKWRTQHIVVIKEQDKFGLEATIHSFLL
jgi:hypothetical protein